MKWKSNLSSVYYNLVGSIKLLLLLESKIVPFWERKHAVGSFFLRIIYQEESIALSTSNIPVMTENEFIELEEV
jgi:hypothetical protein